jgi:hypothetical protein
MPTTMCGFLQIAPRDPGLRGPTSTFSALDLLPGNEIGSLRRMLEMDPLNIETSNERFHTTMKRIKTVLTMALLVSMAFGTLTFTTGCNEGPAEDAGEAIDDAAEDAGDAIEDATD